jgi:hypothetical protein
MGPPPNTPPIPTPSPPPPARAGRRLLSRGCAGGAWTRRGAAQAGRATRGSTEHVRASTGRGQPRGTFDQFIPLALRSKPFRGIGHPLIYSPIKYCERSARCPTDSAGRARCRYLVTASLVLGNTLKDVFALPRPPVPPVWLEFGRIVALYSSTLYQIR